MKKVLILLITILFVNDVYALNADNISKVEYKWYKDEKLEEKYYPKKDKLLGFYEDENQIQYGDYSEWDDKYCSYPNDYYLVEEDEINKYIKIIDTRYIELEYNPKNFPHDSFKEIKIFYEQKVINYKIIKEDEYGIKIDLEKEYETEKLSFYIDIDSRYLIYLSNNIEFTKKSVGYLVMPQFDGKELEINDKWIIDSSTFVDELTNEEIDSSQLKYKIGKKSSCRIREIYTYRYKVKRKYYDDNYHIFIDGYIPDVDNSIIYYSDENNKIYKINNNTSNYEYEEKIETGLNSNSKNNYKENQTYITKYIDKEVKKIPLIIYIIISFLVVIIITQSIKIMKKNDD